MYFILMADPSVTNLLLLFGKPEREPSWAFVDVHTYDRCWGKSIVGSGLIGLRDWS